MKVSVICVGSLCYVIHTAAVPRDSLRFSATAARFLTIVLGSKTPSYRKKHDFPEAGQKLFFTQVRDDGKSSWL